MFCNTCHHLPLISDTYPPNEPQMFSTGCLHLWSRMAGMKQVLICKEPQPRPPAAAEKIWIKWLDGYLNGSTYGSKNKTMLVLKPMVWGSLILRNLYIIIYIYIQYTYTLTTNCQLHFVLQASKSGSDSQSAGWVRLVRQDWVATMVSSTPCDTRSSTAGRFKASSAPAQLGRLGWLGNFK